MADDQDDSFAPNLHHKCAATQAAKPSQAPLIESAAAIATEDPESLLFQHTVFCQVGLPYRNPGDTIREWEREQGAVSLFVEAGRARHPDIGSACRGDPSRDLSSPTSTPRRYAPARRKSTSVTA